PWPIPLTGESERGQWRQRVRLWECEGSFSLLPSLPTRICGLANVAQRRTKRQRGIALNPMIGLSLQKFVGGDFESRIVNFAQYKTGCCNCNHAKSVDINSAHPNFSWIETKIFYSPNFSTR